MDFSTWKVKGLFKADAQKCAEEISSIALATPKNIVSYARNENTELHKCFEWDDTEAAGKWREQQARVLVCNLVIKKSEPESVPVRTFFSLKLTDEVRCYQPTKLIVRNEDSYAKLLKQAREELIAFQKKYKSLVELEPVFEEIKKVV